MKTLVLSLAGCIIALICGCTVVPPAQEVVYFQLQESRVEKATSVLPVALKIISVESSEALNSRRILVSQDNSSLHALPGARWTSPTRTLVRERLIETLRANGHFAAITSDTTALSSDLELHSVLRNFSGDFSNGDRWGYIRMDATLADSASREVIATREFRVKTESHGDTAKELVQALSEASDKLGMELVNWIDSSLSK